MCNIEKYCIVTDVTFVFRLIIAYQQKKGEGSYGMYVRTIKQLK